MRVSCNKDDPGYETFMKLGGHFRFGKNYEIYLDGKPFHKGVTADEEKGEVVTYKLDDQGKLVLDPIRRDLCLTTLHGKVEVRPKRGVRTDLLSEVAERPIKMAVSPGSTSLKAVGTDTNG